ncbi:hypothetical protein [Burkholderia territorii]|uniref:hypothetical protein n=1 Tax=Burkholderia territorii TaxID=1503055 RepID=UPI000A62F54B|nr:hypothetical protein [Burkholderia territorii]
MRQEGSPYHQSFLVIHAASRGLRDTRAGSQAKALVRDANPDAGVIITAAPMPKRGNGRRASMRRTAARRTNESDAIAERRRALPGVAAPHHTRRNRAGRRPPRSAFVTRGRRTSLPPLGAPRTADARTGQFFTMRNKPLRYKNSWCMAQIRCFAMPKNVPQYKMIEISLCFF